MVKFLLIGFMGWHLGYVQVPGIASEAECLALIERLAESKVLVYSEHFRKNTQCIPYEVGE